MKKDLKININDFKRLNFKAIYAWPIVPKIFFLLSISLFTIIASYFLYINGKISDLNSAERKEIALKEEYIDKKKEAINIPIYEKQLKEIESTFGTILKQLPNQLNVDDIIRDTNQAGLSRNVKFNLFEPDKNEIKKDFYAELPITLEVEGTFYDIGSFTADLAALSRIIVLTDIKVSTIDNSDNVLMKAKAKTYRYLTEEEIQEQARIEKEKLDKEKKKGGLLSKGKDALKSNSTDDKNKKTDTSSKAQAEKPRNSVKAKTREEVEKEKKQIQDAKK